MAKRPSWGTLLVATMTGAAGAGVGYLAASGFMGVPVVSRWIHAAFEPLVFWDWLAFPLLMLVVLGTHEIGHLLGGLSQGMRFLLLIFGPFQWYASTDGIRFRWVTHLGQMGGIAATTPVRMDNLQRQMLPMIAGGPLASLLLALVAGGLASTSTGRVASYAAIVMLLSAMTFLVTAVPLRAGGFMSDGMQFLEVRRGGAAVVERADLIRLMATSLAGVRPRDWDPALVARVEAMHSAEPLRLLASWMMLLHRAMDGGETARARELAIRLAEHSELYPDGFRQSLHIELCIEAALRHDRKQAEQHFALTKGGITERSRLELAGALVSALQGDAAGADRRRIAGEEALRQVMDPGLAHLTADQLAAARG